MNYYDTVKKPTPNIRLLAEECADIGELEANHVETFIYALLDQKGHGYITPRHLNCHTARKIDDLFELFYNIGILDWEKKDKNRYYYSLNMGTFNDLTMLTKEVMSKKIEIAIMETILLMPLPKENV